MPSTNRYRVMDGYTIDPQRRAQWSQALRSGAYAQGRKVLTRVEEIMVDGTVTYRHCCLGVACELASAAGAVERVENLAFLAVQYGEEVNGYREEVLLPEETSAWLGLRLDGMPLGPDGDIVLTYTEDDQIIRTSSLSSVNDQGMSFQEIADIIDTIPDNPTD